MIKKLFQIIALILVVLLSLRLRLDKYSQIPIPGQSVDEYSYSWVGLSLLTTGMPIGNSGISGYENQINKFSMDGSPASHGIDYRIFCKIKRSHFF